MKYNFYKNIFQFVIGTSLFLMPGLNAHGQIISTIAGDGYGAGNSPSGRYAGDGGPATAASFDGPWGVVLDDSGNVYIGDVYNNRIRKITIATGIMSTIAGNNYGYGGDGGQGTDAQLAYPQGVATDTSGNVYISDLYNNRIRKIIKSTGIIITIAGTGYNSGGGGGYNGDGIQATDAELYDPYAVAVDDSGNVFISDTYNNRIRKINQTTGIITTIAGNGFGSGGGGAYAGDGGAATDAELHRPFNMAIDDSDNIYIADSFNNAVRKVSHKTGIITTIAGNGTAGYSGDGGPATDAEINSPDGITADAFGNVYVSDQYNNSIRKVTNGIITTFAGNGTAGYNGDGGYADTSELQYPQSVTTDKCGNLYIADYYNQRVRKITLSDSISVSPLSASICNGSSDTLTVSGADTYNWTPSAGLNDSTSAIVIANPSVTTTYTVVGITSCFGTTPSKTIVVTVNPAPALDIEPQTPVLCNGQTVALYVVGGGANFTWSPSTGLGSTTGDTVLATPTVNVTYTVSGSNSGGCVSTGTDEVLVVPAPNKPTITKSVTGDTLISSATQGNQWYVNDTLINGATNQNLDITGQKTGSYAVEVINPANGCSATSDSLVTSDVNQLSVISKQLSVYPNPTSNSVFITVSPSVSDLSDWNLEVTDVLGRIVFTDPSLSYSNKIDLPGVNGVYFITVVNREGQAVFPVIRQN